MTKPEIDDKGNLVLRIRGKVVRRIAEHNLGWACDHDGELCCDGYRCYGCGRYVWYWNPKEPRK